jgi:hydroxymethylbilane synthase
MSISNDPTRIVIATRESRLALWQAEHARSQLQQLYPGCQIEVLGMTTRGDEILDRPLAKVGGKGLFIKELEAALLDGRADLAVHSMKDVPMVMEPEFALVAIGVRDSPLDALVSSKYASLEELPLDGIVGTSSVRREALLHLNFPYLTVKSLRGNLDTRLRQLDAGAFDAIILAAAGLNRLGLGARIRALLPADVSLPAAGQGALGYEALSSRPEVARWLAALNDPVTACCVRAERSLARAMGGGCEVPLGAYAQPSMDLTSLRLRGFIATPDAVHFCHAELDGSAKDPETLGLKVAAELRAQGADEILASLGA